MLSNKMPFYLTDIAMTGRQNHNEVIAYQLRQSFKPGEVNPDEANKVGYELASKFLGGNHAFIVATHTDRNHILNHIVFCSTALDCNSKFRNFGNSSVAVAELSDDLSFPLAYHFFRKIFCLDK